MKQLSSRTTMITKTFKTKILDASEVVCLRNKLLFGVVCPRGIQGGVGGGVLSRKSPWEAKQARQSLLGLVQGMLRLIWRLLISRNWDGKREKPLEASL